MAYLYMYVVDRDFGFAPNPFHGICTLATCKPRIRSAARVGDWVVGMGGGRLRATGRCIFAMHVTNRISFDDYWNDPQFQDKKPIRNGSLVMLVGDNIYHRQGVNWVQADSHHSNSDGTTDLTNVANDTSSNSVLLSNDFYYFGRSAPLVPREILDGIDYQNGRNHRKILLPDPGSLLVSWLKSNFTSNRVIDDPFDLEHGSRNYSHGTNRIS